MFVDSSFCFFFFKQKTAYEIRISDWSSDVCSSDLLTPDPHARDDEDGKAERHGVDRLAEQQGRGGDGEEGLQELHLAHPRDAAQRKAPVPGEEAEQLAHRSEEHTLNSSH